MTTITEIRIPNKSPAVALRYCGSGPLVVLLHGIGGNASNWDRQLTVLASDYTAAAWDMRGYGRSDDYGGPLLVDDLCDDLRSVLDYFEVPKAHVVGLSMGGMIAQEFYRRFPNRVSTMLLANTNVGFGAAFTDQQKAEFVQLRRQPLLEGKEPSDLLPSMLEVLLGPNPPQSAIESISASIRGLRKQSYIKAIEAIVDFDSSDITTDISVPVLLVSSTCDRVIPLESMEMMNDYLPDSELFVFKQVGHLTNLERPEEFNELMLDFLAQN